MDRVVDMSGDKGGVVVVVGTWEEEEEDREGSIVGDILCRDHSRQGVQRTPATVVC